MILCENQDPLTLISYDTLLLIILCCYLLCAGLVRVDCVGNLSFSNMFIDVYLYLF